MPWLLICDLSKGDFSLFPASITSTVLEINVLIFSIFAVISGVTSVFCIPKDFLFKFLFLMVGGIQHWPQRLASLECKQGPLSHFLQAYSHVGMPRSQGICLLRQDMRGRGGGCSVVSAQDLVLKIPGFPHRVTLRRKLPLVFLPKKPQV